MVGPASRAPLDALAFVYIQNHRVLVEQLVIGVEGNAAVACDARADFIAILLGANEVFLVIVVVPGKELHLLGFGHEPVVAGPI